MGEGFVYNYRHQRRIKVKTDVLNIEIKENPEKTENEIIEKNLYAFNDEFFGKPYDFSVFLKDNNNKIQGGIIAQLRLKLKLLYLDFIWIDPAFRKRGFGRKIVDIAEKIARNKGCKFAELETLDFQAEDFYKKLGYCRFGVIKEYMGNYDYVFMRKTLDE